MGRVRLALVAAALLGALLAPAQAHAGKRMEVALQDDSVFYWRAYYPLKKAFKHTAQLKVSRIRINLLWGFVVNRPRSRKAPKHIRYRWHQADYIVRTARKHGVKVQFALSGPAPAWATHNHRRGPNRPSAKRFARFVRAAARHFKGRVDRYSIWNEPNHIAWLYPKRRQASLYRRLYRRAYREIKRVDRHAKVLIGETAPYASKPYRATPPLLFLRKLTCVNRRYKPVHKCPKLFADGYAHHPYEYFHSPRYHFPGRDNVTMGGLRKLVHALNRLAARKRLRTPRKHRLNIYLTEFGYFARGKYRIPVKRRARYLRLAFEMARRNPRVKQMLQYILVRTDRFHKGFDTSIVGRNGKPSRSYKYLRAWARKMAKRHKIAVPKKPRKGKPPKGRGPGGGGGGPGGGGPPGCPLGLPICP